MIDYDPHDWRDHLFDVRGSMVRDIALRVLACAVVSVAVVLVHRHGHPIAISEKPHMLIGVALGLLLVFRTNASYDRFWEGRKLWGGIVNETRNLARGARVLLAADPALAARLIRWTIVFAYATMHALRGQRDLGPAASDLPAADVRATLEGGHVPTSVGIRMSEHLARAREAGLVSDYVHMALDQNVQLLIDYMGGCERIHKTPLPFAYVVHLRRALIIYCLTLPLALVDLFGAGTIVVAMCVAFVLLGIEEIGVEIEDPFGTDDNDLPLERICSTIEGNLRAVIDTMEAPAASGRACRPGALVEE